MRKMFQSCHTLPRLPSRPVRLQTCAIYLQLPTIACASHSTGSFTGPHILNHNAHIHDAGSVCAVVHKPRCRTQE